MLERAGLDVQQGEISRWKTDSCNLEGSRVR